MRSTDLGHATFFIFRSSLLQNNHALSLPPPLSLCRTILDQIDLVIRTIYGRTILVEFHPKIGRIEIPLQAVRRSDIAYRVATRRGLFPLLDGTRSNEK